VKVGSLFSGYGGLDMAVGGELAWYSDIEPASCTVMKAHYPGVQNIGDVTQADWENVEPVDVLTGGYPCQPFSNAGNRKGTKDDRHLWPFVRDAISALRPRLIILENVRGHLSLGFADVLADLADLGLSARWGLVRASDAGAPHHRARLFIVAYSGGERYGERERPGMVGRMVGETESGGWSSGSTREKFGTRSFKDACDVFGEYTQAIRRWEGIVGREAPYPTVYVNQRDNINPRFVEWMMGLPDGWVTGQGLSLSQELKMLGNGVVPQQARLALELL